LSRRFGDLKVRPKLMVLHNLFFLMLTVAVYFALIPPLEAKVAESVKIALFVVLGCAYILAVLLLELVIMPRYVYDPIGRLLVADEATRQGDRAHEIIDDATILGDEIGQIMRSRNATVLELRKREDELSQALERLEAAQRNLEAQDRLVSLGLLSASVAHEMNTPLAVLHGSIEKLLETTADPSTRQRLERMFRVAERLRRISAGLLDFARVRKAEMAPLDVAPLLDEAWHLVAIDEKAAGVRFENRVAPGSRVVGNADRLLQVFVNLLRNALHAVPSGGHIAAAARAASLDGAPALAVSVEDNGPGIPPEVLPEIFEAFVSTRLDARGTGLGLAVAEGIVDQHGGRITASNCPAGGARLEVTLPAPALQETP
jgi:signal transduction histidine kinase